MTHRRFFLFPMALLAISICLLYEASAQEETFDSPRIAALAKDLKSGNPAALTAFWEDLKGKAPLVEPVNGDEQNLWVTFVWRGNGETKTVLLYGGMPWEGNQYKKPLQRLLDTDLWYRTEKLPRDSRFTYLFTVNLVEPKITDKDYESKFVKQTRRDSLNPRPYISPPNASIVELPGAPAQPWVKRLPGVPAGEVKRDTMKSDILKEERAFGIYTPPGYDPAGKPPGLLVLFDGEYAPLALLSSDTLDNLIVKGKIPPVLTVLVHGGKTRNQDLACSADFADFLARELLPWVGGHYTVSADPKQTVIGGWSLGGSMAVYCAMRYPEVFGNVLSLSGSFWFYEGWKFMEPQSPLKSGWLAEQFAAKPRLALRFYLEVGRFEQGGGVNMVLENRRMRDVLVAKGYPVSYSEYNGGHDAICWRGSLADGLIALLGK